MEKECDIKKMNYEWLKPDAYPFIVKSKLDIPKIGYTFEQMTAMIQRLERTKKRSGQVNKYRIQIIIDEFKRYRKEIG